MSRVTTPIALPTEDSVQEVPPDGRARGGVPSTGIDVGSCPVCGGEKALDLGLCLPCAGQLNSALAFVRPPRSALERAGVADRLKAVLPGDTLAEAVHLASGGHRAVAAVPAPAAGAVLSAFAEVGIPVRIAPTGTARGSLPNGLAAASTIAVVLGCVVGWMTSSAALLVASPMFGALLWLLAQRELRKPVVRGANALLPFPRPVREKVVGSLSGLPDGAARDLLSDVVRLARLLHERARDAGDDETPEDLGELLVLASEAAQDLARLDEIQDLLDGQPATGSQETGREADALVAAHSAHARLHSYLNDAIWVMGQASRRLAEGGGDAAELARLARDIDGRLRAHAAALDEVEDLLSSGSTDG